MQLALLKNVAIQTMQFCADQAVQILGGAGFMRGRRPERIYREVKAMMIPRPFTGTISDDRRIIGLTYTEVYAAGAIGNRPNGWSEMNSELILER